MVRVVRVLGLLALGVVWHFQIAGTAYAWKTDIDIAGISDEDLEYNPGGFVPLNGNMVILSLSTEGITEGQVTLAFISGQNKVKVWDNADKTGSPIMGKDAAASKTWDYNGYPGTVWVEGVEQSGQDKDVELRFYASAAPNNDDRVRLSVYVEVDTVVWEKYGDNLALDTNPSSGGGKRIYPDKKSYNDSGTADRKKVTVRAKLKTAAQNVTIYFKSWDVDEPGTNATPVDANGTGQGGDNRGTPKQGTLSATSATTNAGGEATVELTVTMNPGDNFKVTASTCSAVLQGVTQAQVDGVGDNNLPQGVKMTEMLTVWRKLHLELDSMAGGQDGPVGPRNIDDVEVNSPHANESRCEINDWNTSAGARFEGGKMTVTGGGTYDILDHEDVIIDDDCIVSGNASADEDKNATLTDDDGSELPRKANWSTTGARFQPAYISVVEEADVTDLTATFDANLDNDQATLSAAGAAVADRTTSEAYWIVQVFSCHQADEPCDGDPDSIYHYHTYNPKDYKDGDQNFRFGIACSTPEQKQGGNDDNICAIFLETCRDWAAQTVFLRSLEIIGQDQVRTTADVEQATTVHEVGHLFGCNDTGGGSGAMGVGQDNPSAQFEPVSIHKIRSATSIAAP